MASVGALKLTYLNDREALKKGSSFFLRVLEEKKPVSKNCIDYFTGGSLLPGRSGNAGDYRYGFNGYEADDEIKGERNSYTTQFRQYDPRLFRWLSPDPMEK